jgi:RNA polymerase sigma-70 factor, ECF subfamily
MDERAAIQKLLRGDIEGLDPLMQSYQVGAIRASYLICQNVSMAEDIVQSAFIRAYERIEQFDTSRPFGPWFLRSVVNDSIQATVKERRVVPLETEMDSQAANTKWEYATDDVAQQIERLETGVDIRAAIAQLPVEQRATIVLRYYLDLTDNEISARLHSTPSTVRWRLHAARKRLRTLLPAWLRPGEHSDLAPSLTEVTPVYLSTEHKKAKDNNNE